MDEIKTPLHPKAHICSPDVGRSVKADDGLWYLSVTCYVCDRFYEACDITDIMTPLSGLYSHV